MSETNSNTNISIKQRLVGALVLVSLAVIFIPMILDGEGPFEMSNSKTFIPDEPSFKFESADTTADKVSARLQRVDTKDAHTTVSIIDKISEQAVPSALPTNASVADKNKIGDISDDVMPAPVKPSPERQAETRVATVAKTPAKHSRLSIPMAKIAAMKKNKNRTVKGWAVQLGSFKTKPNALRLRDKLRVKGFASYVEAITNRHGARYRVRVGPELKRVNAERLKKKLAKVAKVDGLIVSH